jgi:hypothetical protein
MQEQVKTSKEPDWLAITAVSWLGYWRYCLGKRGCTNKVRERGLYARLQGTKMRRNVGSKGNGAPHARTAAGHEAFGVAAELLDAVRSPDAASPKGWEGSARIWSLVKCRSLDLDRTRSNSRSGRHWVTQRNINVFCKIERPEREKFWTSIADCYLELIYLKT